MGKRDAARAERPEKGRLRGIVRGRGADPVVLRIAELEVDETTRMAPQQRHEFDLDTKAGLVAVRFPQDVEVVPFTVRKERWEDLENDPAAEAFREDAPAPHVKVRLRSFVLRDGDEVHLWGTTERTMVSAGFREAAERDVAAIDVLACGVGDDGEARIAELEAEENERNKPEILKRRSVRRIRGLELVGIGLVGVVALAAPILHGRASLFDLMATLFILLGAIVPGIMLTDSRYRFESGGTVHNQLDLARDALYAIVFTAALFTGVFAGVDATGDDLGPFNHAPIMVGGSAGALLLLAAVFAATTRREARLAKVMLDAPPHPLPWEHKRWGSIEGTIATGAKTYEVKAAAFSLFEETFNEGSTPNTQAWSSQAGPFVLDADGKATIQIHAERAEWGTTVRFTKSGKRVSPEHRRETLEVGLMPVGARILAVGRVKVIDGMCELVSAGRESLLLFATEGQSPRAVLRMLRVRRMVLLVFLVVLGLAELALVFSGVLGAIHSGQGGD